MPDLNESEKQFSLTRSELSICGRAKSNFSYQFISCPIARLFAATPHSALRLPPLPAGWGLGIISHGSIGRHILNPAAPVLAFIVGAVLYFLCAKMGILSPVVPVSGALAEATK